MSSTNALYQIYLNHPTICTDTRNITRGCLFFALKGERFNGNEFASQALEQGASYVIVDDKQYHSNDQRYILVPDVLTALQQLAIMHRQQLTIPVIGLTGSNGKTTTKELINAALSEKFKTFATKGNLNNHIGVPLSVLSITQDIEVAVIEMGANHQREIEFLCTIARPTHGLITNVGMAHLEGFGGFEGVKKGKSELYSFLKENNGTTFIDQSNQHLKEIASDKQLQNLVWYGTQQDGYISAELISADPIIKLIWSRNNQKHELTVNLTGAYNFENILAAVCIATFFGLQPDQINGGLSGYLPKNNRSQVTHTENNTVICDFYNANPSSMSAALKNLEMLTAENKMLIIGDMFELGDESVQQHRSIAKEANKVAASQRIFIGKHFHSLKDEFDGLFFSEPLEAGEYLKHQSIKGHFILLKGSRGMALEQLLPYL